MNIDELKAALAAMPADEREALISGLFADYEGEGAMLDERGGYAQALRDTPMPEGRKYGRVYTAANPLEHIARVGSRGLGEYQRNQTNKDRRALSDRRSDALRGLATAVGGMGTPPAGAPAMSPVAPAPSPLAAALRGMR